MFSFYGSKGKIVKHYPFPKHNKIKEPFAGSARYSLLHWENDVTIVDKYPIIISVWKWLQHCSPNDILSLPKLKGGDNLDDFAFDTIEAKWLMGFMVQQGVNSPRKTVSKVFGGGRMDLVIERDKSRIAQNLHKIKHWKIILGDYVQLENEKSTWFIDPPYEHGGEYYHSSVNNSKIDYASLSEWCKMRDGQVIVCENSKAGWMDFKPFRDLSGSKNITKEVIWYKDE